MTCEPRRLRARCVSRRSVRARTPHAQQSRSVCARAAAACIQATQARRQSVLRGGGKERKTYTCARCSLPPLPAGGGGRKAGGCRPHRVCKGAGWACCAVHTHCCGVDGGQGQLLSQAHTQCKASNATWRQLLQALPAAYLHYRRQRLHRQGTHTRQRRRPGTRRPG